MLIHSRSSAAQWICAVLTCCSVFIGTSPLKLVKTTPAHMHVTTGYNNVTFTCEADGPISDCQFRWRNEIRRRSGPVLDLGEGLLSRLNESFLNKDLIWYHYSGDGLDAGHCGVTMYVKGVKQYTVACRVRAKDTGWRYGLMTLFADNYAQVPVAVSHMQQVSVGEELNLMCKTDKKLNSCRFYLPGFGTVLMDAGRESPSPSTHHYYGAGLEQGECGLTLKAKEINNGVVTCTVDTSRRDLEWNTIPLIVTRPPDTIKLEVTTMASTSDPIFQARCTVSGSRPAATITWLLDDQILREDDENDDANATWTWPYQPQTLIQMQSVPVNAGQAQRLTCRAEHPALKHALVASRELTFDSTQCPVGESEAVAMTCEVLGVEVNCSSAMVGTIQWMTCKPGYVTKDNSVNNTRQCQQGGAWDREAIRCVPDCGRLANHSGEGNKQAEGLFGEFPWHVGIYEQNGEAFKYICGGSLISRKFVISGASCLWEADTKQKTDPSLVRVAAGKASLEWTESENPLVQRRNVSRVLFHDRFSGFEGLFKYDIALIELSNPIHVTDTVNVVCVDWDGQWEKTHLRENNTGMLIGQGFNEDGTMADKLNYVNMTFVQNSTCFSQLPEDTQEVLSDDKFCAWSKNENRSLCPGDVGGGLVFPEPSSGKVYLHGIASVGFLPTSELAEDTPCHQQYYMGFTSVAAYIDWINVYTGLFPSRLAA